MVEKDFDTLDKISRPRNQIAVLRDRNTLSAIRSKHSSYKRVNDLKQIAKPFNDYEPKDLLSRMKTKK